MKIAVLGLGYVGLPLTLALGKHFNILGYDANSKRIKQLNEFIDANKEVTLNKKNCKKIFFTDNQNDLSNVDVFICCVPTPVKNKKPDLSLLINATNLIASKIKKKSLVIYESTVYPGTTDEICIPILKKNSKLKLNKDFFVGYSPERINPGLNSEKISKITKVISGSSLSAEKQIYKIYNKIIKSGVFIAKSIKVAEAAKIIENTQRDLNIALMNEFSKILNKLDINSHDVIKAASTKWNFNKFYPGLVGGHCIGVDPYYLAYKAKQLGIKPNVILSGRKINDGMYQYVFKNIKKRTGSLKLKKILCLGVAFKENCLDFRNSMSVKLIKLIKKESKFVDIYDPLVNKEDFKKEHKIELIKKSDLKTKYDAIVVIVPHNIIIQNMNNLLKRLNKNGQVFDIKGVIKSKKVKFAL